MHEKKEVIFGAVSIVDTLGKTIIKLEEQTDKIDVWYALLVHIFMVFKVCAQ